jgi:hypothetical protein
MSFSQTTKDKINGWGSVMRFITPILITIMLFILSGIKTDIREIKIDTCKRFERVDLQFEKVNVQFSNHLEHHRQFEIVLAERLTSIETSTRKWR